WPGDVTRSTASRDGGRSTASRDAAWPGDATRSTVPREGSRSTGSTAPRDGAKPPGDAPRANGRRDDAREDSGPPGAPTATPEAAAGTVPAAILQAPPRGRRGAASSLPLTLGPLTVHSLGTAGAGAAMLPVGFHSTRLFASARRPWRRCLYACRVAPGPRCEIEAEDDAGKVLVGATPDACHGRLLKVLAEVGAMPAAEAAPGAGDEFFGLSHPSVRRLLRGDAREDDEDDEDDED
ncbi:TBRG1 regulator, partial [Geococcyx californianus]|nr:TBRG1 regulator [Geococcyx californianus]